MITVKSLIFYFHNLISSSFSSSEEKTGCFCVSVLPVIAEIELHNRRYWDILVSSLQASINRDLSIIDNFTKQSSEILTKQPQNIEEIGNASKLHSDITKSVPQVC